MLAKYPVQHRAVADIPRHPGGRRAGNTGNALEHPGAAVAEIVEHQHTMARLLQGHHRMAADIAGAARAQDRWRHRRLGPQKKNRDATTGTKRRVPRDMPARQGTASPADSPVSAAGPLLSAGVENGNAPGRRGSGQLLSPAPLPIIGRLLTNPRTLMKHIQIRGARTHNLKNVDLDLPRDKLVVLTGLSGSGKSSLAFDTLYAEGQRRYVESLSAYARQFLSMMEKPDVDHIEGLSPAISIEQKSTSHNPRSTVGTVTEIYDYLRLLYARAGIPRCPEHGTVLEAQNVSQMVDAVMALLAGTKIMLLAPVVQARKGEYAAMMESLRTQGFLRARIDGEVFELDDPPTLDKRRKHSIEVVVDRLSVKPGIEQRLAESFETALALADGVAFVAQMDKPKAAPLAFSNKFACPICGYSIAELEPRLFSFNNPSGACPDCDGLGVRMFFDPQRIVAHPTLSLAGGAIRGWDHRNAYYFQMIK